MSHGDRVISLPEGFEILGGSEGAPCCDLRNVERKMYGIMFHPDSWCTRRMGRKLLANFCAQDRQVSRGDWDHVGLSRAGGGRDPRPGGVRQGHLRAVGRRRFLRSQRC